MASEDLDQICKEPMFCVETMLNSLHWSWLVYDFDEVHHSPQSLCLLVFQRSAESTGSL